MRHIRSFRFLKSILILQNVLHDRNFEYSIKFRALFYNALLGNDVIRLHFEIKFKNSLRKKTY